MTNDRVVAHAVDSAKVCETCGERCTSGLALREHTIRAHSEARPAEPTSELREQLTRWAMDRFHLSEVQGLDAADALLSGPLAPLLAKLRAVEELHAELADERSSDHPLIAALANRLRRALDAEVGR